MFIWSSLPAWLQYCLCINAVLGSLIYFRIHTATKIMRQKDEERDNIYHSSARRDAQHWDMQIVFLMCITLLIPRLLLLILSVILEYICVR